jgi:hypothetical protein
MRILICILVFLFFCVNRHVVGVCDLLNRLEMY